MIGVPLKLCPPEDHLWGKTISGMSRSRRERMSSESGTKPHPDKNAMVFAGWQDRDSPKRAPFTLLVPTSPAMDGWRWLGLHRGGGAGCWLVFGLRGSHVGVEAEPRVPAPASATGVC